MISDHLLVFAMKEESQDVFDDYNLLHTGIGKVNAAHALMSRINRVRPSIIVNLGTAGSRKHSGGTIINCTSFIQRDMDVRALGFELFQTPFSSDPLKIEYGRRIENLPEGLCGTGDNFASCESADPFDVVDMEAYALALICKREEIPFLCLKYVSDGANGESNASWNDSLHRTAKALKTILENIPHE